MVFLLFFFHWVFFIKHSVKKCKSIPTQLVKTISKQWHLCYTKFYVKFICNFQIGKKFLSGSNLDRSKKFMDTCYTHGPQVSSRIAEALNTFFGLIFLVCLKHAKTWKHNLIKAALHGYRNIFTDPKTTFKNRFSFTLLGRWLFSSIKNTFDLMKKTN